MNVTTAVGFLTYDLQPFTEDCIYRVSQRLPFKVKAFPLFYHPRQEDSRVHFRPSGDKGTYLGIDTPGATPEGFASNLGISPALHCVRESDIIILFGLQGVPAILSSIVGKLVGRRVVSVNQTLPVHWERRRLSWIRSLKKLILSCCTTHIYQTPASREVLRNVYGVSDSSLVFAPFEAGATRYRDLIEHTEGQLSRARSRLGANGRVVFFFVGNLHPFKGVPEILKAAKLLIENPNWICVFAGPEEPRNAKGGTIEYYRRLGRHLGVDERCAFLGRVDEKELAALYMVSDVVVLPTRKDCFPKVLVEAGLAGKPVITTSACGAVDSIVMDGESGIVVPPGDIEALAKAMKKLLNGHIRKDMGRRLQAAVSKFCDPIREEEGFRNAILKVARP